MEFLRRKPSFTTEAVADTDHPLLDEPAFERALREHPAVASLGWPAGKVAWLLVLAVKQ
jgi:hypothetical protein